MYQYAFHSSIFCSKILQVNVDPPPFQHLLPPDSQLPKLGKQSYKNQNQDALIKKNEQIKFLTDRNNELVLMASKKQAEIIKITNKYNDLLKMYEQIKNNGVTKGMETKIQLLSEQNQLLCEKIRRLQNQLIDSEKQIIRKVKFYEQKNDQSRRLLQKLNQNIRKREQKFEYELLEAQSELKRKNQIIGKLKQENRNLLNSSNDKEEQATRIIQQTQRDRSQNVSTVESKIQMQNYKLNEQITHLTQLMNDQESENMQKINKINKLTELVNQLQNQNEKLKSELQYSNNKLDSIQLMQKQLQGRYKLLESDRNQKSIQYENRLAENMRDKKKLKQAEEQLQSKIKQMDQALRNYQIVIEINSKNETKINQILIELENCREMLKEKISEAAEMEINYQQQKKMSEQLTKANEQLEKRNEQLGTTVKKNNKKIDSLEQLLQNFKSERLKVRSQMDNQWKQMTDFYEKEIEKLHTRIIQLQPKPNGKQKTTNYGSMGNNIQIS